MQKYPETQVTIEGHTDSRGSAEYNRNLSQQRADTIAGILKDRFGVPAARVTAIRYGESRRSTRTTPLKGANATDGLWAS